MQLPKLVPPSSGSGPWLPGPVSTGCERPHFRRVSHVPVAVAAAGLVHVRLRRTVRLAEAKQASPSAADNRLHDILVEMDLGKLREVAKQVFPDTNWASKTRARIVTRLTEPEFIKQTRQLLLPDEDDIPRISPAALEDLEFHLEAVTAKNFPKGVGQARSQQVGAAEETTVTSDAEQEALQICDVRVPLTKKAKRRALQSLEVGAEEFGSIVEVSLNDGLRVDIGAEIDVLVPLSIQGQEDAPAKVAEKYPLESELVVKIEEVSTDPARRFPVIASLKMEPLQSLQQAQTALRPHGGASDRSRSEGVELSQVDDWQPAGPLEVLEELEELPWRPPPEVLRSLGRNRQLQDIEVPEAMRPPAPEVSDSAREAWINFAENRVEELRWELRCRERLATDLLVVEADILRGRLPSIPIGLLGLTVMEDGRRYMLPQPDGDSLRFSVHEEEDLHTMIESCRARWAAEAVEPQTRQKLALYFACADAWHARMVQAAEAVEIQRLGWGRQTEDDDDDDLALAVEEMIAKTPELQDQASMEGEYGGCEG